MRRAGATRAVMTSVLILCATSFITACGGTSSEPAGTSSTSLDSPAGYWSEADTDVYLKLNEGGGLEAFDGCNTLEGSWNLDGANIAIGIDGGTERGCNDIPNVWLSQAETATYEGKLLVLFDGDGAEIGTLAPTEE